MRKEFKEMLGKMYPIFLIILVIDIILLLIGYFMLLKQNIITQSEFIYNNCIPTLIVAILATISLKIKQNGSSN